MDGARVPRRAARGEAGLRRGEIAALEWGDIDFARNFIHVQRSESKGHVSTTKGGRSRRVQMTKRLSRALREARHLRGDCVLWRDPENRWDLPHAARGVWDRTLQSWIWMERVQRRAGVEVTGNIHILRHTFCTRLAMAGAPTRVIKEMAGHASITTTERYMHLAPGSVQEAAQKLDEEIARFGDKMETAQGSTKNP
jgi:integrase